MVDNGRNILLARSLYLAGISLFSFLLLAFRLYYLQVLHGEHFARLANENRIRDMRIPAPRGIIEDRNGFKLVDNRPSFDIGLVLENIKDLDHTISELAHFSSMKKSDLQKRLSREKKRKHGFEEKIILRDIDRDLLASIMARRYKLPGVVVLSQPVRHYPSGALASSILGYTRPITREQFEKFGSESHSPFDYVGQSGIEKVWEKTLHGKNGRAIVEVDARGIRHSVLGREKFISGKDLILTIDHKIQRVAETALEDQTGAIAVVDVNTGAVRALVSTPRVNLNMFSAELDAIEWQSILKDPERPLSNKAIAEAYPPGSTFKLIVSVAALNEGIIRASDKQNCPGYFYFGKRLYHCHKRSGHGNVDLYEAIENSCNTYFFRLGNLMGIDVFDKYSGLFGLGEKTGINLEHEVSGVRPSKKWKKKTVGEKWYPGDTLSVSIGQGYLTATPLQLAIAVSAIANGGKLYRPYLVQSIRDPKTGEIEMQEPEFRREIDVSPEVLQIVKEGALKVVEGEHGTGKQSRLTSVRVAGKTGTAQVAQLGKGDDHRLKEHALFVAFAPYDKPEIALAIVVEHAGHGGVAAAPIAKAIFQEWFGDKNQVDDGSI